MKGLSARLLIFNLLLLFLPLASLLYVDTYEKQLLAAQEASLIQQGRIFSSALSGSDLGADAQRILERLGGRVDARIRVVNRDGRLLADSAAGKTAAPDTGAGACRDDSRRGETAKDQLLYRLAVYPLNLFRRLFFPPAPAYDTGEYYSGKTVLLGPEVLAALAGRYGAATRLSTGGQRSVNLYSAIPIPGATPEEIRGVVLVSRSTYNILLNLYVFRLDIIRIFVFSLVVSLVLSLVLSLTITMPIRRLQQEAERVLDPAGRFGGHFTGLKRRDEIGSLSRALSGLSAKLEKRIGFIDRFIADLLHELKNPLTAIRGAVEMAVDSPGKEARLLAGIGAEERRMERLLFRLRELSQIDNLLEREGADVLDLGQAIPLILARYPDRSDSGAAVGFHDHVGQPALVRVNPDRLVQALTNPVDNALSFSPAGSPVDVHLEAGSPKGKPIFRIRIEDSGPGVRAASLSKVFDRFYSDRGESGEQVHSGLGLAIVRSIAAGYGGSCALENRESGGCRFILELPGWAGAGKPAGFSASG